MELKGRWFGSVPIQQAATWTWDFFQDFDVVRCFRYAREKRLRNSKSLLRRPTIPPHSSPKRVGPLPR